MPVSEHTKRRNSTPPTGIRPVQLFDYARTDTDAQIPNILVVDDRPENILLMEWLLAPLGYPVSTAASAREALALMSVLEFAVVLLDVQMPEMDGLQLATAMKKLPLNALTPIVFVTASDGEEVDAFAGYSVGAVDFIRKPCHPYILQSKVRVFVDIYLKTCRERSLVMALTKSEAIISASLAREKRIAETLQRSMMSVVPSRILAGYQVASCYEPALDEAHIGGDFFDAFLLDTDHLALVVGDIMGKGLAAATRIADVKYSVRTMLRETRDPASALQRLNGHMCEAAAADSEAYDEPVCMIAAVLERSTGTIDIAVAGMESPVLRRKTGSVKQVEAFGSMLALRPDAEFVATRFNLAAGDCLVFFTDGITEARVGECFFGVDGVANQLRAQRGTATSLAAVLTEILEAARRHGGDRLSDDSCLLAVSRELA
jgi:serine phosphatase RsbU (regulator of sigma subunit)